MLRWIVSLTALIAVSSVFAQGGSFGDHDSKDGGFGSKDDKGGFKGGDDKDTFKNGGDKDDSKKDGDNDHFKNGGDKDDDKSSCPKPPPNCVPEPASFLALGVGGVGFLLARKKKKA